MGLIVELGLTRVIGICAVGDNDDHALAGAGEQDAVGIHMIGLALGLVDALPSAATKSPLIPTAVGGATSEVGIPGQTCPVEL